MKIEPNWNWGPAWNKVREDVNTLAWLFEEERTIQRLYIQSAFWALSGARMDVDEFARELGLGAPFEGSDDEHERSEEGALDGRSEGEG